MRAVVVTYRDGLGTGVEAVVGRMGDLMYTLWVGLTALILNVHAPQVTSLFTMSLLTSRLRPSTIPLLLVQS